MTKMTFPKLSFILIIFLAISSVQGLISYPSGRRADTVDEFHGKKIPDPYRWLEDLKSNETLNYIQEEQNLTNSYLAAIPERDILRAKLTQLWNYPKFGAPEKAGDKYFTFENTGLQEQDVIYVQDKLDGPKKLFMDPNTFSVDKTSSLGVHYFSRDGQLFGYSILTKGGDWQIIRVRNVTSGIDLEDEIRDIKYSYVPWTKDGTGFFYTGFEKGSSEKPAEDFTDKNKIYYHHLGTPQSKDIIVAEFPDSPRLLYPKVSEDGDYLIVMGSLDFNANTIHILSIRGSVEDWSKNLNLVPIFTAKGDTYAYVSNQGPTFLFRTSHEAPNYKLITVTLNLKSEVNSNAKVNDTEAIVFKSTFLKEDENHILVWAVPVGKGKLLICYNEDVKHTVQLRSLKDGSLLHKFELEAGTISNIYEDGANQAPIWGSPENHKEIFIKVKHFLSPGTIYKCQVEEEPKCEIVRQIQIPKMLNTSKFVTEQVFYPSKDGTKIPMYTVRKKDTPLDGKAPLLLYGYGGFNAAIMPSFQMGPLVFMDDFNGIYACANIRGGGEYGPRWHKAGSVLNKQNSFDDFIAAAEYLIAQNYTTASKLSINGGSNGGYLLGAVVNQRPDLFAAAIPQVGVTDLLSDFASGFVACAEYGCVKDKTQFESILKLSPLANIKLPTNETVQYPAILVTTSDHDDRVPPSQSYKYVAELQHTIGQSKRQTNPILLRVDTNAGHGAGLPVSKQIGELADVYAFIAHNLGLKINSDAV